MTPHFLLELHYLLPEIFICFGAILLLMAGVFSGEGATSRINLASLLVLVVATFLLRMSPTDMLGRGGMFVDDAFAVFSKMLVLIGSVFSLVLAAGWLEEDENRHYEFPVLLLLSVVGMMLMVSSANLLILYLGIELSSLTQYVLAAFNRDRLRSTEAGIKYFVLGSLASGMLLFGISLVYGFSGSIGFDGIAATIHSMLSTHVDGFAGPMPLVPYGMTLGLILILVGLSFKISAAPFHMWTPDVYEGAPTPVTAFFAIAPKVAGTVVLIRLLDVPFHELKIYWQQIIEAVSLLSMLVGAFGALWQTNLKRLLAYSSIGHIGYALVGVAAGTLAGVSAVLVYLAIYVFMSVGAFGLLMMMRRDGQRIENIADLAGISKQHPRFAFAMAVFMFAMAGIPPLAGFFAKMYVFLAAINAGIAWLAVLGALSSVVAAYYYLKIVKVMYFEEAELPLELPKSLSLNFTIILCTAFTLIYVVRPSLIGDPALAAARALFP